MEQKKTDNRIIIPPNSLIPFTKPQPPNVFWWRNESYSCWVAMRSLWNSLVFQDYWHVCLYCLESTIAEADVDFLQPKKLFPFTTSKILTSMKNIFFVSVKNKIKVNINSFYDKISFVVWCSVRRQSRSSGY